MSQKNVYKKVLFLQLFLSLFNFTFAQGAQFTKVLDSNSNAISHVRSSVRDSEGYYWLGGDSGVSRFDGHELIKVNRHSTRKIFIDSEGELWSSGATTLMKLDDTNNYEPIFYPYYLSNDCSVECQAEHEMVTSHLTTPSGRELFGSNFGIREYLRKEDKFIDYRLYLEGKVRKAISVSTFHLTPDNKLLLGTTDGLFFIEDVDDKIVSLESQASLSSQRDILLSHRVLENIQVNVIENLKGGGYVIGTDDGVYVVDQELKIVKHFHVSNDDKTLTINNIISLLWQKDGVIWAASREGINVIDLEKDVVTHLKSSKYKPYSISNNSVSDMLKLGDGKILITTFSGLDLFDPSEIFPHIVGEEKIFPHGVSSDQFEINNVLSFEAEGSNKYWIGTFGSGLYRYDNGVTEHFISNVKSEYSLASDKVMTLFRDSNNSLWVGTTKGLQIFNEEKKRFLTPLKSTKMDLKIHNEVVYDIKEDADGSIWVSTDSAITNISKDNESVVEYGEGVENGFFAKQWIRSVFPLGEQLLVGTDQGLYLFSKADAKGELLISSSILKTYLDSYNKIWILAEGENSIFIYDPSSKKLDEVPLLPTYSIDSESVFNHNYCGGIAEDPHKQLWFICNNSLYVFSLLYQKFIKTFTPMGSVDLHNFLTGQKSFVAGSNGELLIGLMDGPFIFSPKPLSPVFSTKPKISRVITEYSAFKTPSIMSTFNTDITKQKNNRHGFISEIISLNEKVEAGGGDLHSNLSSTVVYQNTLKRIEFKFSDLVIRPYQNSLLQYRLNGYDDYWVEVDGRNQSASYTNLSPGEYQFQVRSRVNGDGWSTTNYDFSIKASLLVSWWAITLYVLIGCFLLWLAVLWRMSLLMKKSVNLENLIYSRTVELSKNKKRVEKVMLDQERLVENIYHQSKTPLQLMLSNISRLKKGEVTIDQFSLRQKNEIFNLSDLTEKVLKTSSFSPNGAERTRIINVYETVLPVLICFEEIILCKNLKFVYKGDRSIESELNPNDLCVVVQCVLENSVKYTDQGEIQFIVESDEENFYLICKDTGIGIPANEASSVLERYTRGCNVGHRGGDGLGLAMVKSIVESYKGSVMIKSVVLSGTSIKIVLPKLANEVDLKVNNSDLFIGDNRGAISDDIAVAALSEKQRNELICNDFTETEESAFESYNIHKDRHSILVIEDNIELSAYLTSLLKADYKVYSCLDAESGLLKAVNKSPDLIITDVALGDMDGFQLTENIRENKETSHIPIIVVTARGDKESQRKSFSLGANDFIVKPFEEESLLKSIVNQLHYVQNIKDKAALYSAQDVHLNSERIISRFLQIVSEEFHNSDISIGDICNEIHISARQLERKTKFFLSRTPKEYLNDYRLVMAQKLIRDGVRLKRVVGMCGFSSQSYFTKCYKVKFGVVPSKDKIV